MPPLLHMLEAVGQHDAFLVLITPEIFFQYWLELVHAARSSCLRAPPSHATLRELVLFEQYTTNVLAPIARQAYAEDSRSAEAMCDAFYSLNPDLADELPGGFPAGSVPGYRQEQTPQLKRGCWGDAVFSMTPFWSAHGMGPAVTAAACVPFQHGAPNALLRTQMAGARSLADYAINCFQQSARLAPGEGPPVREPVRALVASVEGCLCGKYRDEFRARIYPLDLADVRATLDAPQPGPYTHLALASLLYETREFMQHYSPPPRTSAHAAAR
jgi:hypothetical protein